MSIVVKEVIILVSYLAFVCMIVLCTKRPKRKWKREALFATGYFFASFTCTYLTFSVGWNMICSMLIPSLIWALTPKIVLAILKKINSKEE